MVETLQCPSCGAPLDYDPRVEAETVRCPFCENMVMLLRHERPFVPPQIVVGRRPARVNTTPGAGVIVAAAFVIVAAVVAAFAFRSFYSDSTGARRAAGSSNTKNGLASRSAGDGYAQPELVFGSEGIGPGNFKDARSIAVDADGHIYVGEYSGGRIQVFDSSGKFLTQWSVDRKMPLRGMAADRGGTLYVVQSGTIRRYEGTTGKDSGALAAGGYDDVATSADGGLVAFSFQARDDIARLDASGRVTKTIHAAISGQTDKSELNARVACDGAGNVYALGTFNDAVFKFSPEGKFMTQFGGDGDQAGQFRAPSAIAVDNQGRVFVSDFKGVQVFDAQGRYLGLIKVKGAASGLAFDDKGELFVVARTQVYKFPPFNP
jgi:streptogramin lyase